MTAELRALEKVFSHEVERAVGPRPHGLPFQSRAAIYKRLAAQGLVEAVTVNFGSGPFAVSVSGYELTHAGRLLYCASCADDLESKT